MKKNPILVLFYFLVAAILWLLLVYAFSAFIIFETDPRLWTDQQRAISGISCCLGLFVMIVIPLTRNVDAMYGEVEY